MVIATKRDLPDLPPEIINNLVQTLASLPADANEAIVDLNFVAISFFDALGFSSQERVPTWNTGQGADKVDYAH